MSSINSKTKPNRTKPNFSFGLVRNLFYAMVLANCILCHSPSSETVFQLCDNFNSKLDCTEPKKDFEVVYLDQSKFIKPDPNWEDFGNFLYFTARETPGFRIQFAKQLTTQEKSQFRNHYSANLTLGNTTEEMEGFQISESAVIGFHYLGAILKEEFRHQGRSKEPVELTKLGKIKLVFTIKLPSGESFSKERELELRWEDKKSPH
ncbi:hypothetical protein P3G55_09450 [Leptospira sp. 96542]|nr:hypothetical protein [Leptospira sp. 96542]